MNARPSEISPVQARCKPQAFHHTKPLASPLKGAVATHREESRTLASNLPTVTRLLPNSWIALRTHPNARERNRTQRDAALRFVTYYGARSSHVSGKWQEACEAHR